MLTPNCIFKINGVTVNEKIIPDGTVWKDAEKARRAGFGAGSLYKKNRKIAGGPKSVTIHNTEDLNGTENDDGEQYTRATFNENMGSARVHFYVDDKGAWQTMKSGTGLCPHDPEGAAEVSWHSGDGSVPDGGNMTSLSMEIIMGESAAHDAKARDNGARIAAWLLWKNNLPISKLVTHTYWVNKSSGKKFSDTDEQCTNEIRGKKWCPAYIFGSHSHTIALGNWKAFKALVKKYLDELTASTAKISLSPKTIYHVQVGSYTIKADADAVVEKLKAAGFIAYITTDSDSASVTSADITVGDKVKCKAGVKRYANDVTMPVWVRNATLYVRRIEQNGKVYLVSTEPTKKVYTGRVNASDVMRI